MSATKKFHNVTEGKGKGDNETSYQGECKRSTSDSWKERKNKGQRGEKPCDD